MNTEEIRTRNRDKMRLWRERNKDRVPTAEQRAAHNERNRRYRERHPDRIQRIATESNVKRKVQKTEWAREHYRSLEGDELEVARAKARVSMAKWVQENRDISRERSNLYYWTNRETISTRYKQPANRSRVAAYARNRKRSDPMFRLKANLRKRLWCTVKAKGIRRGGRTFDLIGCSVLELRSHLEKQFKQGMTWANYGRWHVDHIRPCASFDLSDMSQQRECFHFTNLQPLWAQENHMKSKRIAAWV